MILSGSSGKINEETDWTKLQECIKSKFERVKFNNQNTSDVSLALSIWNNAINEAVLDVRKPKYLEKIN
jgi:hypothetical protein